MSNKLTKGVLYDVTLEKQSELLDKLTDSLTDIDPAMLKHSFELHNDMFGFTKERTMEVLSRYNTLHAVLDTDSSMNPQNMIISKNVLPENMLRALAPYDLGNGLIDGYFNATFGDESDDDDLQFACDKTCEYLDMSIDRVNNFPQGLLNECPSKDELLTTTIIGAIGDNNYIIPKSCNLPNVLSDNLDKLEGLDVCDQLINTFMSERIDKHNSKPAKSYDPSVRMQVKDEMDYSNIHINKDGKDITDPEEKIKALGEMFSGMPKPFYF